MTTLGKRSRITDALAELQGMILDRFPTATFEVVKGYDPPGTYLEVHVPTDDFDQTFEDIFDAVGDRLLDFQDVQRLRIYVMPIRPRAA